MPLNFRENGVDYTAVTTISATEFPPNPFLGQEVWRTDLEVFFKWNGQVWLEI